MVNNRPPDCVRSESAQRQADHCYVTAPTGPGLLPLTLEGYCHRDRGLLPATATVIATPLAQRGFTAMGPETGALTRPVSSGRINAATESGQPVAHPIRAP